jgi:Flp pilus assembly protein TadG
MIRCRDPRAISRDRKQRGGALVEFVIILPLLILLVFGLWEFGRIIDAWLVVTNAAREGARYASVSDETDLGALTTEVQGRVQTYLTSGYGPRLSGSGDVHLALGTDCASLPTGSRSPCFSVTKTAGVGSVTVHVRATVDVHGPVAPVLSNPFPIAAQSTMRER